jgi:hypothetical protein
VKGVPEIGDKVQIRMKRYDGSVFTATGFVSRVWGNTPYAATVLTREGEIRVRLGELRIIKRLR